MRGAITSAAEIESRCIMCSSDFRFVCTSVGPGLAGENAGKEELHQDLQRVPGCVTALWLLGRPLLGNLRLRTVQPSRLLRLMKCEVGEWADGKHCLISMRFPDLLHSSPSHISDGRVFWRVGDDLCYICTGASTVGLIHAGCCPTAQ